MKRTLAGARAGARLGTTVARGPLQPTRRDVSGGNWGRRGTVNDNKRRPPGAGGGGGAGGRVVNDDQAVESRVTVARGMTAAATATDGSATDCPPPKAAAVGMAGITPAAAGEPTPGSNIGHGQIKRWLWLVLGILKEIRGGCRGEA